MVIIKRFYILIVWGKKYIFRIYCYVSISALDLIERILRS